MFPGLSYLIGVAAVLIVASMLLRATYRWLRDGAAWGAAAFIVATSLGSVVVFVALSVFAVLASLGMNQGDAEVVVKRIPTVVQEVAIYPPDHDAEWRLHEQMGER